MYVTCRLLEKYRCNKVTRELTVFFQPIKDSHVKWPCLAVRHAQGVELSLFGDK